MRLLALKEILVATDLEEASFAAVVAACRLAEAAGAMLHAMHVVPPTDESQGDDGPTAYPVLKLNRMLSRAGARIDPRNVHVVRGDPADAISLLANRINASVIVLGPHRERSDNTPSPFLGFTALNVVTNASAPCLIVSQGLCLPLERVLVPIDLSETARGGLLVGLSWASALRAGTRRGGNAGCATLTALHVEKLPGVPNSAPANATAIENELAHARRHAGNWAGVSIDGVTTASGDVVQSIVDYAEKHQPHLVVLGTRGLGLDRVERLGSIAAAVMPRLSTPVLLVPPTVWTSFVASP